MWYNEKRRVNFDLSSDIVKKLERRTMGANNKICPNCGRKMKQQFIGLQHCKCGMSWKKGVGFFKRNSEMIFALERRWIGKKVKLCPVIRAKKER